MDRPTTRVNGALLANCSHGQIVRLIGKVVSLDSDQAVLEAADGVQVTVRLARESVLSDTFVEVIGKVVDTNEISELTSQNMGENLDLALANKVVELAQQYPEVFPRPDTGE
ncbi:replication factor A protein 3 [Rhodotorula sp. JG-1b]|nr:replication factor A protein 3 [Rhodotorula sp. JG-1b]